MNDKTKQALELAMGALEEISSQYMSLPKNGCMALAAIKEALAEQPAQQQSCYCPNCEALSKELAAIKTQQQEPVVWMYVNKSTHETKFQKHMSDFVDHSLWSEAPLYGEPLANHELQCVCGAVWLGEEMVHLPDKRPPASKPWVGLTSEDKVEILRANGEAAVLILTEAKLREKNA